MVWWKHLALWKKIFIGLCLGLIVGLLFKDVALMLKPVGTLFINMIKMLIVPLVFATLVTGITSMEDLSKMRRIGIKTFSIYLITTAIAVAIGLAFGILFEPGSGVALSNTAAVAVSSARMACLSAFVSWFTLLAPRAFTTACALLMWSMT